MNIHLTLKLITQSHRKTQGLYGSSKNDDKILPLKKGQKVAVIGEMAKAPRFQGAGCICYQSYNAFKCI